MNVLPQAEQPTAQVHDAKPADAPSPAKSWILEYRERRLQEEERALKEEQEQKLAKQQRRLDKLRKAEQDKKQKHKRQRVGDAEDESDALLEFVLNEYTKADAEEKRNEVEEPSVRKIYYCSRTHSQLSQFVNEVKKTSFVESVKVVTLGSRKTYCINKTVQDFAKGDAARLDDKCVDLQKGFLFALFEFAHAFQRKATQQSACTTERRS